MKKGNEYDNILDECLERVIRGEDIQACLAQYPEYAAELEPLLRTASETKQAIDIKPRPEFRQKAAYEFQAAIRNMPVKENTGFFKWQVRWVMPVAIVIVIITAGSGTVLAAGNSLPDDPLYKVKLATEVVQLAFTPSDLGKAELYAKFADKRVEEIIELADKGESQKIDQATERMNTQLVAMANLTGGNANISGETATAMLQSPAAKNFKDAEGRSKQAPVAAPAPGLGGTPTPASTTNLDSPPIVIVEPTTDIVERTPPAPLTTVPIPETTEVTQDAIAAVNAPLPEEDGNVTQPMVAPMAAPSFQEETAVLEDSEAMVTAEDYRSEGLGKSKDGHQKPDRQEKLKRNLSKKVLEHLEKLQEQLENAPEELKPALERAIEVIINGYETNLSNLR